mmetsp:Transcript_18680/g.59504  ORF Transcript_18680/g.59504 Transcript_18680/m.59504 type:complete len:480 (-) Transcript_18680:229-1668(-)
MPSRRRTDAGRSKCREIPASSARSTRGWWSTFLRTRGCGRRARSGAPRSRTRWGTAFSTPTASRGLRSVRSLHTSSPSARSRRTCRPSSGRMARLCTACATLPSATARPTSRIFSHATRSIGFGVELGCLHDGNAAAAFAAAFDVATRRSGERFVDPLWKLKRLLCLGEERELRDALRGMRAFSGRVIAERRRMDPDSLHAQPDLLSRFMAHGQTDEQLHDTIINFVLAGRDTTAILLSWTLYTLAQQPDVVAQLRAEAEGLKAAAAPKAAATRRAGGNDDAAQEGGSMNGSGSGSGGGGGGDGADGDDSAFDFASIQRMPYLRATLTEVLRLYPSVPLDFKTATRDEVLPDGTHVCAGERVMFVAWSMGRQPSIWPDPKRFDPTRHLDPQTGAFRFPPPFAFPVFLAGPRTCLGKEMAYLGAGLLVTSLLERFDFSLARPAHETTYDIGLTLWAKGGVFLRCRHRDRQDALPLEATRD